jgi:hypothetical protein
MALRNIKFPSSHPKSRSSKKRIELERGCCADITVNMSISGFGEIPRVLLVNIPKKESHFFLLRIIQLFILLFENPKDTTRGNI